jgi:hypothetical protein
MPISCTGKGGKYMVVAVDVLGLEPKHKDYEAKEESE